MRIPFMLNDKMVANDRKNYEFTFFVQASIIRTGISTHM
jgi:hypothetical protein